MNLQEAVEILIKEKGAAETDASNGYGSFHGDGFVEAVSLVLDYIGDTLRCFKNLH